MEELLYGLIIDKEGGARQRILPTPVFRQYNDSAMNSFSNLYNSVAALSFSDIFPCFGLALQVNFCG